mmetsp:Transcript_51722/g.103831  ORF Transcript_51722/g.103831 Transcript_51722/m.103831 type:complete len:256 (-) Transcript_51722:734-1501(-)
MLPHVIVDVACFGEVAAFENHRRVHFTRKNNVHFSKCRKFRKRRRYLVELVSNLRALGLRILLEKAKVPALVQRIPDLVQCSLFRHVWAWVHRWRCHRRRKERPSGAGITWSCTHGLHCRNHSRGTVRTVICSCLSVRRERYKWSHVTAPPQERFRLAVQAIVRQRPKLPVPPWCDVHVCQDFGCGIGRRTRNGVQMHAVAWCVHGVADDGPKAVRILPLARRVELDNTARVERDNVVERCRQSQGCERCFIFHK